MAGAFCVNCGWRSGAKAEPALRDDGQPIEKVGGLMYVLAFLMAGFIGLWVQYWTRNYGWRGFWINLIIFLVVVGIYVFSVAASQSCYDDYNRYIC